MCFTRCLTTTWILTKRWFTVKVSNIFRINLRRAMFCSFYVFLQIYTNDTFFNETNRANVKERLIFFLIGPAALLTPKKLLQMIGTLIAVLIASFENFSNKNTASFYVHFLCTFLNLRTFSQILFLTRELSDLEVIWPVWKCWNGEHF